MMATQFVVSGGNVGYWWQFRIVLIPAAAEGLIGVYDGRQLLLS